MEDVKWAENVIIADADYADHVAFDLTVNFERMLGRRVPPADLALWAECLALDGGLKEGEHETQVVLVHSRDRQRLENFVPADYQNELNGQACRGRLGELAFTAVQTEELAGKDDLLLDILQLVCQQAGVKRLMLVVTEQTLDALRPALKRLDSDERRTTVFTMQPVQGGAFRQEQLGFSLMAALGISGKEIEEKLSRGER